MIYSAKHLRASIFLELTRSPDRLYPLMGDLPGGVFENDHNESPATLIQRAIREQIGVHVQKEELFVVHEWNMLNVPSEYIYCAIIDSQEIVISSKEYIDFRWISLNKAEESNLLPSLKKIVLQSRGL